VARASLSLECTDNEVCTDKFCTDSESDKVGSHYPHFNEIKTLVFSYMKDLNSCTCLKKLA
jgi:hypothetical protein